MRLNGVTAIMQHLGYKTAAAWKRLKRGNLPYYRDPDDPTHLWAFTEELDVWDRKRGVKKWPEGSPGDPVSPIDRVERGSIKGRLPVSGQRACNTTGKIGQWSCRFSFARKKELLRVRPSPCVAMCYSPRKTTPASQF
jgi:hypothetical protein